MTRRELLEKLLDKYAYTRGYPCGDTKTRDNAVDQALTDLKKIEDEERLTVEEIAGALARGYCSDANSCKVLDVDLIKDMTEEVYKAMQDKTAKP